LKNTAEKSLPNEAFLSHGIEFELQSALWEAEGDKRERGKEEREGEKDRE